MVNVTNNDLLQRIRNMFSQFSRGQKLIAGFITDQYDKAAFMTAAKLGDIVGVSESTVVRFATELGYDGYPKLQKALQEIVKSKLTSVQSIEMSSSRLNDKNVCKEILKADIERIRQTIEEINEESFNQIVQCLLSSRTIYVLGVRSSFTLANFLWFNLNFMFDNVKLVSTYSSSQMIEQMFKAGDEDAVIGISFPRYSRSTFKAIQYVKERGTKVITITDSHVSPLATLADYILTAKSDMVSFADSLVAPLSLINALIVAIGMRKKDEIYNTFTKLEEIWDENHVFDVFSESEDKE